MAEALAGGQSASESASKQNVEAGDGVAAQAAKDQKAQSQATEAQYSKSQIDEMIANATKGMVSRDEMERNVGNVRSQYDRARNEERGAWVEQDRNYQARIHELTVKDMDENARARFERDLYAKRAAELEERHDTIAAELEASKLTGQYLKALKENFGVDVDQIDLSDINNLSQSAFDAAAKSYKTLKAEVETLKSRITDTTESVNSTGLRPAQDVVTNTGSISAAPTTLLDLRKSVSQRLGIEGLISEDKLFEMAERPEITGVDMNVVLEAIEAEIQKDISSQ